MNSKGRKGAKPCCGRCGHPDYSIGKAQGDGRPEFVCRACGNRWTCGKTGGDYVKRGG